MDVHFVRSLQGLLLSSSDLEVRSRAIEERLETHPDGADALVAAALEAYGDKAAITTAFGPSGLCLLDMALRAGPTVEAIYIETGFAFDETRALAEIWKERGLRLRTLLPRVLDSTHWSIDVDACCASRKVEPNAHALSGKDMWIAALRRDESPDRAATPVLSEVRLPNGHHLLKLCPIVSWSEARVWTRIRERGLPYNPLHDRGYRSLGCAPCTRPVGPEEPERGGRWPGKNKTECGLHVAGPPRRFTIIDRERKVREP